jgi:hypothetical protein
MAIGKGLPLSRIEVCQDERDLSAKLGPERIHDALELGTVGSPRQKYLHDGRLLAEDVEATIPWWASQHDDGYDRSDHHRSGDEQHETEAPTAVPSSPRLLA